MAIVNCVLGKLSGRVGDIVFRQRNGKTFASQAPRKREKPFNEGEKANHNKFAYVAKIASALNNHPVFKEIWKKIYPKKSSPYHKIFKHIYKYIGEDLSGIILITPDNGFSLLNPKIIIQQSQIIMTTALECTAVMGNAAKKKILAAGIIIIPENKNSLNPGMRTINIQSDSQKIIFRRNLSFVLSLSERDRQLMEKGKKIKILLCLIIINKEGEPENYSLKVEAEKEFNGKDWN
jgi:hypothetical protein